MQNLVKEPSLDSFGQEELASPLAEMHLVHCPTDFRSGPLAVLSDAFTDPVAMFGHLLFWGLFGLLLAAMVGTVAVFFLSGMPLMVVALGTLLAARRMFRPD